MKVTLCDRCKEIIENPRHNRVVTLARPLPVPRSMEYDKASYHGNDPTRNDIIWEKELCIGCAGALEAFFEEGAVVEPEPDTSTEPEIPDEDEGEEDEGRSDP